SSPDLPTAVLSAAGETDQPDDGILPERRQPGAPALSVLPLDLLRAPHVVRPGGGRRAPAGCRDAGERRFSRRLDLASVRGPRRGAAGGRVAAPCAPGMRDGGELIRRQRTDDRYQRFGGSICPPPSVLCRQNGSSTSNTCWP